MGMLPSVRPRRADITGHHVLITGAASGIGRAVADQLAARGAILHLTDIDGEGLADARTSIAASGGSVATARTADVTSLDAIRDLAEEVHAQTPAVDAVLNVAGIAIWGKVEKMSAEQWQQVIDVNLMGPIHVIETFVPPMIEHGRRGHLVNVSSAAGLLGLPWHAAYSASKFGVRGVSEVLRFDLARHEIAVTLACPGAVDTPLTESMRIAGIDTSTAQFAKLRRRFQHRAISPQVAAERIVGGMLARKPLVYTSADIRALHAVQRYVPPAYAAMMHAANRMADRAERSLR
ncbi:short chain dehydrogenase [Branchiibius sp. NY16-3462-2]|nr:short chain dehydrogenase [Branchiibius sp. NY16-3462-2]